MKKEFDRHSIKAFKSGHCHYWDWACNVRCQYLDLHLMNSTSIGCGMVERPRFLMEAHILFSNIITGLYSAITYDCFKVRHVRWLGGVHQSSCGLFLLFMGYFTFRPPQGSFISGWVKIYIYYITPLFTLLWSHVTPGKHNEVNWYIHEPMAATSVQKGL